jgi:predicted transcriptional regulator
MERLYFLAKVEEGLRQAEAGETLSHEEARKRLFG